MFTLATIACWLVSEHLTTGFILRRVRKTQSHLLSSTETSTYFIEAYIETHTHVHAYRAHFIRQYVDRVQQHSSAHTAP